MARALASYSCTVDGHVRFASTACTSARSSLTMVPLYLAMVNSEQHQPRLSYGRSLYSKNA